MSNGARKISELPDAAGERCRRFLFMSGGAAKRHSRCRIGQSRRETKARIDDAVPPDPGGSRLAAQNKERVGLGRVERADGFGGACGHAGGVDEAPLAVQA